MAVASAGLYAPCFTNFKALSETSDAFLGVSKTVMASSYGLVFSENNAGGFVRVY